jgi:Protein of unknown function (DUF2778)
MALQGKLILNGADYAPFNLYGVGTFMAHSGTLSKGCITIAHNSDFAMIRNALLRTQQIRVPCMRSLIARGWVEVVANGSVTCP